MHNSGAPTKVTFYKRPLPVPPAVEFSSLEGRKLFQDALAGGMCEGFFKLIEQFMTQDESTFCGLASIAMVLNALAIDPRRPWRGAWRYFHDTMLDCCLPLEVVKQQGTTLEQAACLARCNGAQVTSHHFGTFTVDEFRAQVEEVCKTGSSHIIVSYSRRTFLQTGDGHFSPIGAYHKEKDLVLILDVARFKYPPHWVPLPMLVEAMSAQDPFTQKPRGYMLLAPRAPIPITFTLDISHPSAAAWTSALRFLDTVAPQLLASIHASHASGQPMPLTSTMQQQQQQQQQSCFQAEAPATQAETAAGEAVTAAVSTSSSAPVLVHVTVTTGLAAADTSAAPAAAQPSLKGVAAAQASGTAAHVGMQAQPIAAAAAAAAAEACKNIGKHSAPEQHAAAGRVLASSTADVLQTLGDPRLVQPWGVVRSLVPRKETWQEAPALVLPPDAGPGQVLAALMCLLPLEGANALLAVRSRALMQDVQDPAACQVCSPLWQCAQQEQQQQQQQQRRLEGAQGGPGEQEQQQQWRRLEGAQGGPVEQQQQQQQQQGKQPEQRKGMGMGIPSTGGAGCRGNGGYCTESGCGARGSLSGSPTLHHPHLHAASGNNNSSGGSSGNGSASIAADALAACVGGRAQGGGGSGSGCGTEGSDGGNEGTQGSQSAATEGLAAARSATQALGSEGGAGVTSMSTLSDQDPVVQELKTTELFEAVNNYLTTAVDEGLPTPLHIFFKRQQQQQQGGQDVDRDMYIRHPASQVCTLHMVSKVTMLLLLCGLEQPCWSGLWSLGTPERRQWWLWVGKPLETLPFLSAEVKYLRIQLGEVQKFLCIQGEQKDVSKV